MATSMQPTSQRGEVVEAGFDSAAPFSDEPSEISRLATIAVMRMLLASSKGAGRIVDTSTSHLWQRRSAPVPEQT